MKNKKEFFIAIFFFSALFLFLFFFLYQIEKPRNIYYIYKNECHKENYFNDNLYFYDSNGSRMQPPLMIEICKKIKVDSMPYQLDCSPGDYNRKDYPADCLKGISCLSDCARYNYDYTPIFKDDKPKESLQDCLDKCYPTKKASELDEEWLNNHCLPFAYVEGNSGKDIFMSQDDFHKKFGLYIKTSKYKCGDYEVDKQ